jgi:hypothetical protein
MYTTFIVTDGNLLAFLDGKVETVFWATQYWITTQHIFLKVLKGIFQNIFVQSIYMSIYQ